LFLLLIQLS